MLCCGAHVGAVYFTVLKIYDSHLFMLEVINVSFFAQSVELTQE